MKDQRKEFKRKTQDKLKPNKTYSFSTGWFGRASEDGHNAKNTKVHCLRDGKPLCGYKPHKTMQYQFCSDSIMHSYIECPKCKEEAFQYEYIDKQWIKKLKQHTIYNSLNKYGKH